MIYLIGGVLVISLLWWLGKNYAEADPKQIATFIRKIGGLGLLVFAMLLLLRGRIDLSLLIGGVGWWMAQGQRLDTYLHSRFPFRRKNAYGNPDPGADNLARSAQMTEEEALEILGLQAGASEVKIRDAHRVLMKKLHPDQGGTNYLAMRVNQAKDILLKQHH